MEFKIDGVEETLQMLAGYPERLVKVAFTKALVAACNPIQDALNARTPVEHGDLKDSLMADIAIDNGSKGGVAQIGYGKLGYIARFVEYGHRIVVKVGEEDVDTGMVVHPHPFIRPAFEASASQSLEAFKKSIEESIAQMQLEMHNAE